jgi:hypothetical protein
MSSFGTMLRENNNYALVCVPDAREVLDLLRAEGEDMTLVVTIPLGDAAASSVQYLATCGYLVLVLWGEVRDQVLDPPLVRLLATGVAVTKSTAFEDFVKCVAMLVQGCTYPDFHTACTTWFRHVSECDPALFKSMFVFDITICFPESLSL